MGSTPAKSPGSLDYRQCEGTHGRQDVRTEGLPVVETPGGDTHGRSCLLSTDFRGCMQHEVGHKNCPLERR